MQLHPEHIPNPIANDRRLGEFHVPLGLRVVYESSFTKLFVSTYALFSFQRLLENGKLLLVLADRDRHSIYLETLSGMDAAIKRGKATKPLNRDKVGEDVLFAYDEAKRMLTVCASAKVSPTSLIKVGF